MAAISTTLVNSSIVSAADLGLSLVARVRDALQHDRRFTVEWTAPNYLEVEVLWGAITLRRGERRSFVIEGKPEYCQAVIAALSAQGGSLRQLAG